MASNQESSGGKCVLRETAKRAALTLPPLRRLFEARDAALRERDAARQERDAAIRERDDLRRQIDEWHAALRPATDIPSDLMPEWFLPPSPYIGSPPQRYTDNYEKYVANGGVMRPAEDVRGFIRHNPYSAFDRPRLYFLSLAIDLLKEAGLPGGFAELGVDKGNTASVLARGAQRLGKLIYLLDTFEGFSERDLIGEDIRHLGSFTDTSVALVQEHVTGEHIRFVKGYFPDTAEQIPVNATFCLVHLDCDLYKPFAAALDFFWPRLVPGGFLIMHDYSTLHWEGAIRAVDEFFADKAEFIIPIPDMAGTVAVRKSRSRPILPQAI